jgi:transposase
MFMLSLESAIANDALVRIIDAFVAAIDLKSFGFSHVECCEEGRPPFHPGILMKLYLYGIIMASALQENLNGRLKQTSKPCG